MTLTVFCALCGHSREQHVVVWTTDTNVTFDDPYCRFYCLAFCPCNGSTTFQGKGTLTPTRRVT